MFVSVFKAVTKSDVGKAQVCSVQTCIIQQTDYIHVCSHMYMNRPPVH